MKKLFLLTLLFTFAVGASYAQFGNWGDKLKRGVNAISDASSRSQQKKDQEAAAKLQENSAAQFEEFTANNIPANALFVCKERGSARGTGTKESPLKDIQKAIDMAPDGGTVCIAEGNYLGTLDRGWIEVKGKYVSLIGGFNSDFTDRDPNKYITKSNCVVVFV